MVEQGQFKIKGYDGPIVECDKCGSDMHLKLGRFGKYMGCTNCDNTRKILKNGEVAPPKEEPVHFPELKCEKSDAYLYYVTVQVACLCQHITSRNHVKLDRQKWLN